MFASFFGHPILALLGKYNMQVYLLHFPLSRAFNYGKEWIVTADGLYRLRSDNGVTLTDQAFPPEHFVVFLVAIWVVGALCAAATALACSRALCDTRLAVVNRLCMCCAPRYTEWVEEPIVRSMRRSTSCGTLGWLGHARTE